MIRMFVGIPALMFALVGATPQPTPTDAPLTASASPASISPVPAGPLPTSVIYGPGNTGTMPFAPPPAGTMRRDFAEFSHFRDEQLAYRQAMLNALTPAHRELVGQIVGELAIAPSPDTAAATRRLNAALSAGEAQNVLRVEQQKETAMFRQFAQVAAEHGAPFPRPGSPAFNSGMHGGMSRTFGADAASILLRTAAMTLMTPTINVVAPAIPSH